MSGTPQRGGYRFAIDWLVANDDTSWATMAGAPFSVTAALVADLYNVSTDKVTADIRAALATPAGRRWKATQEVHP